MITKEEAHDAIRRAGYTVNVVDDIGVVPMWTGFEFNFSRSSPAAWDLHEVFHLAVANRAQRRRPDFGLGRHVDAEHNPDWDYFKRRDTNPPWGDEFVVKTTAAQRIEILACDLFPVMGLMFPAGESEARVAASDFGLLDFAKYNRPKRGERAVNLGYDVLSKFVDMPVADLASHVSATWRRWRDS